MAAGLGFKDFTTGEVLTAADVDGYLMQGIWVFASAAARDAAVTSPQEGNFAFLKDTNTTTYYTGSAWTNLDTTGMVNPMTTTGDIVYSSSGSTPARLGIGSTGQVLTVAGGVPSWASAAGGGSLTLLSTTTLSGASTTISGISGSYKNLYVEVENLSNASAANQLFCIPNNSTNKMTYVNSTTNGTGSGLAGYRYQDDTNINMTYNVKTFGNTNNFWSFNFYNYASSATRKTFNMIGGYVTSGGNETTNANGYYNENTAISSLVFTHSGGNWAGGTVRVYGVN